VVTRAQQVAPQDGRVRHRRAGHRSDEVASGRESPSRSYQYYVENADSVHHFPPGAKERLRDYIQRNFETAKKAFQAGARMVVGSDAVYAGWGLNMRELDWFVKMGMTPAQALKTATTEPAAMLGMEKSLGAVAPGFYADIVAVAGDPLADITAVSNRENVRWVMRSGRVVVDKTSGTGR
jgi:imidazolonepropionase-like amidohydrolase